VKVFRSSEADGVEPPGHFGGLRVFDAIAEADTGGRYRAQLSVCPPGGGGETHSHDALHQLFVVLDGEYVFDRGDGPFTLGAGDAVLFHAGDPHGTRNESDRDATVLVVTCPA